MTCGGLILGMFAVVNSAAALWATLLVAACVLLVVIRRKLETAEKHIRELDQLLDLAARRRRHAMDLFQTLGSAFETSISLENLLRTTVAFFMRIAQATGGIIYMIDREGKHLLPAARCGTLGRLLERSGTENEASKAAIPLGEGLVGEVAMSGRPQIINDRTMDTRLGILGETSVQIENAIAVPLRFRDHSLGVLVVVNRLSEDGQVGKPFGRFEFQLLEALTLYAATAIHLTLSYLEQAEKQRLDFDLGVASEIQQLLLPQHSPVMSGVSIAGHSRPAYRVGGDHYDFIPLGPSTLGVVVADVSGKGVTGALVMAICHSIVRSQAATFSEPAEAVRTFRRLLLREIPDDRFISMVYGILDADKRQFTFARAGHEPLLCYRAASGIVEQLSPRGTAIGLDRGGRPDRALEQQTITLAHDDGIVLYTDGITETLNQSGQEFGLERLTRLIAQHGKRTANDLLHTIYQDADAFAKGTTALDDQTLVVIKAT